MTFDEWMNEIEVFSARRERLYEDLKDYQGDNIEIVDKWLEAAYNVGRVATLQEIYDFMYKNEDGDYDFVMWRLKNLIEESK